jgi:CelD/BcsL family acetyltransferase involved in cellulose biosynthesis
MTNAQIIPVTTPAELDALRGEWNQLAGEMPLLSWDWLGGWWRHYSESPLLKNAAARLWVLSVRDDQRRLVGLAPWYVSSSNLSGRVVRFLGDDEVCTDHLTLLCAEGHQQTVADALARWLFAERTDGGQPEDQPWDLLDLSGVDGTDSTIQHFLESLRRRQAIVHVRPGTNCWRLDLPGTWEEYLAMLSKCQRKRVRRLERAYFESGRATVRFVETTADLDHGFDILTRLHRLRWQSRGEPGVFQSPSFVAFHRQIASQFCEQKRLRISWTELDGQPVAAEYQFTGNGTIYAYQSGMDPATAEDQPGNLSMIGIIRSALAQGYRSIDLLRGDEPYKAHWRAEPNATLRIRVLKGKWSGWLRQNAWATARQTKQLLTSLGQFMRPACRSREPSGTGGAT